MAVYANEHTAVKKISKQEVIGYRVEAKVSELKRYKLYLSQQKDKTNTKFMEVRLKDGNTDIFIWLGFDKDSKILSIYRADSSSALSYIKSYLKTLLEVYKDKGLRVIDLNIKDTNDVNALCNSERIIYDFCPSVIIWEVMSDDFYKDRATQFFMLGNYANREKYWNLFNKPDAWSTSYYDLRFNGNCHDYTFAGQRFKISKGILYFKENIPVIKYNSGEYNTYKVKYHTELFAVKLIDFEFIGKIKEYAIVDKNAPYIPEEYYRSEV